MDNQDNSKLEPTSEQATNKAKAVIDKAKSDLKIVQAQFKAEQKARLKAEKALAEMQETLAIVQNELEQERQDRLKAEQNLVTLQNLSDATRAQIEEQQKTLGKSEQQKALENVERKNSERKDPKPVLSLSESPSGGQRVSFVVRLIVDERGQITRTEIEHAQSDKKDVFPLFHTQRLADFITSTIATMVSAEKPALLVQTKPPIKEKPGPVKPELALTIKDLQIVCTSEQGNSGIIFEANKPFIIQTYFSVDEIKPLPEHHWNVPFDINIYAQRIDNQSNAIIATESDSLVGGIRAYRSRTQISGLPAGLFRLIIILKLQTHPNIVKVVQIPFLQMGNA